MEQFNEMFIPTIAIVGLAIGEEILTPSGPISTVIEVRN